MTSGPELTWLSVARLAPYLQETSNDYNSAMELYGWNARMASAAFETIGHFELLLRNTLDAQLSAHIEASSGGIPWFLMPLSSGKTQTEIDVAVSTVRDRLRQQKKESRDQIIASLNFGFWTALFGSDHDELWRKSLHKAFPHSSGRRSDLAAACNGLRIFRNRLAHHDSLLTVDIPFQLRQVLLVAGWINPMAKDWIRSLERVTPTYAERPVKRFDTVVVPARDAWALYEEQRAYVCQAGRTFRPVDRIAFYAEQTIKADVPYITKRLDNVEWSAAEASRLVASDNSSEKRLGEVIAASLALGWSEGRNQVFLLSAPGDPRHRTLPAALPHDTRGRGSAFTQRQRYVSLHDLETASSTADL